MLRKPLLLIAPVLALVSLVLGGAFAPAHAAGPPAPAVQATSAQYPLCIIGVPYVHATCIKL
jgi:hypothetical protein